MLTLSLIIIFLCFSLQYFILSKKKYSGYLREIYLCKCRGYIFEYYPDLCKKHLIDIASFSYLKRDVVNVVIEIKNKEDALYVNFILRVKDFDSGNIYVEYCFDRQIRKYRSDY